MKLKSNELNKSKRKNSICVAQRMGQRQETEEHPKMYVLVALPLGGVKKKGKESRYIFQMKETRS